MSSSPVALHKAPGAGHIDGVPRVPEPVVLEADTGLVSRRFAVAFDDDAVQTSITEIDTIFMDKFFLGNRKKDRTCRVA